MYFTFVTGKLYKMNLKGMLLVFKFAAFIFCSDSLWHVKTKTMTHIPVSRHFFKYCNLPVAMKILN